MLQFVFTLCRGGRVFYVVDWGSTQQLDDISPGPQRLLPPCSRGDGAELHEAMMGTRTLNPSCKRAQRTQGTAVRHVPWLSRRQAAGAIGIALLLSSWLFVGFYEEREWGDIYIFLKHRPSFKLLFRAPLGEADRSGPGTEGYLTPDQEKEESAYVEFVEAHGGYRRSFPVLPSALAPFSPRRSP
jgi:hypothetical protein